MRPPSAGGGTVSDQVACGSVEVLVGEVHAEGGVGVAEEDGKQGVFCRGVGDDQLEGGGVDLVERFAQGVVFVLRQASEHGASSCHEVLGDPVEEFLEAFGVESSLVAFVAHSRLPRLDAGLGSGEKRNRSSWSWSLIPGAPARRR